MRLKRWVGFSAVVLFAACRGDSARQATNASADTAARVEEDSAHMIVKSPQAISTDTVGPGFKVTAEFTNDTLIVSPAAIPAGEFTITAQNNTKKTHKLEIVGSNGGRYRSLRIAPGASVSINGTLIGGDYNAYDPDVRQGPYRAKFVVR
jgi:hypothetical protein